MVKGEVEEGDAMGEVLLDDLQFLQLSLLLPSG